MFYDGSEQTIRAGSPFEAHKHFSPGKVLLLAVRRSLPSCPELNLD